MITLNVESLNLEAVELAAIKAALELHPNNKTQAALTLGCDRRSLYRKMERFGMIIKTQLVETTFTPEGSSVL